MTNAGGVLDRVINGALGTGVVAGAFTCELVNFTCCTAAGPPDARRTTDFAACAGGLVVLTRGELRVLEVGTGELDGGGGPGSLGSVGGTSVTVGSSSTTIERML